MIRNVPLTAGIELGGTKSVALIARDDDIVDMLRIPTGAPEPTLYALSDWIAGRSLDLAALGIGSFGPLCLDRQSSDFGRITHTPKPGWAGTDVYGHFARRFALPIGFDTDVAGAALAEGVWGASAGCRVHVYITIGTGIGGGLVVEGRPVHGLIHPEFGHVRVRRRPGDTFAGTCPFHGDCLEGLASGPAIAARAGTPGPELAHDHSVWGDVACEMAELVAMLMLTLSPERIVIGGGVAQGHDALLAMIRVRATELLNAYPAGPERVNFDHIICNPALGDRAGPLGAIMLAKLALGAPWPSPVMPPSRRPAP